VAEITEEGAIINYYQLNLICYSLFYPYLKATLPFPILLKVATESV